MSLPRLELETDYKRCHVPCIHALHVCYSYICIPFEGMHLQLMRIILYISSLIFERRLYYYVCVYIIMRANDTRKGSNNYLIRSLLIYSYIVAISLRRDQVYN